MQYPMEHNGARQPLARSRAANGDQYSGSAPRATQEANRSTQVGDRMEHWRTQRTGTVQYITTDRLFMVIVFDDSKIEYRRVAAFVFVEGGDNWLCKIQRDEDAGAEVRRLHRVRLQYLVYDAAMLIDKLQKDVDELKQRCDDLEEECDNLEKEIGVLHMMDPWIVNTYGFWSPI